MWPLPNTQEVLGWSKNSSPSAGNRLETPTGLLMQIFDWFGEYILFWIFLICEKLTIKVFLPFEIFCYGYNCIKLLITSGSLAFTYHDAKYSSVQLAKALKFICPDKSQVPREKNPGGWGLWGAGILLTSQYLHHAYINILLSLHHAMWIILSHWQGKKQVVISLCFFNTELIDLDETVLMGTSICWRHKFIKERDFEFVW